ncbi:MAG: tetratricopeptide repeat protein [Candidatus Asgardarchaeia archaeon]
MTEGDIESKVSELLDKNDLNGAIKLCEDFLKKAKDGEELFRIGVNFGNLLLNTGLFEKAVEVLKSIIDGSKESLSPRSLAILSVYLSMALINLKRYEEADSYLKNAEKFMDSFDNDLKTNLLYSKALVLSGIGNIEESLKILKDVLEIYKKEGIFDGMLSVYMDMANILVKSDRSKEAIEILKKAKDVALKTRDKTNLADVYSFIGDVYELEEDLVKACNYFLKAAESYIESGFFEGAAEILDKVEIILDELPRSSRRRIRKKVSELKEKIKFKAS